MIRRTLTLALFAAALLTAPLAGGGDAPSGFVKLFNGSDLTGWKSTGNPKVWGATKGILHVSGGGGGWLMTEKQYGDFVLRLEYKMSKASNSGVALRAPLTGDPAYVGMEIQLIDDKGWPGKLASWQHTGSIYNVVPAGKINSKDAGEWNQMTITAKGRRVKIEQNGATLVDADLDDFVKEHGKRHPGISRKEGHIGLQSYNTRVEFRNIFLKDLTNQN